MPALPHNVEWIQYPGKPRKYVAYGNGVWRLHRDKSSRLWHAYRGTRVLTGRTLQDIGRKVESSDAE